MKIIISSFRSLSDEALRARKSEDMMMEIATKIASVTNLIYYAQGHGGEVEGVTRAPHGGQSVQVVLGYEL